MAGWTNNVPRIEFRGRYAQVSSNVMTPVAKSNIGSSQSEEDLEVKGGPALYSYVAEYGMQANTS